MPIMTVTVDRTVSEPYFFTKNDRISKEDIMKCAAAIVNNINDDAIVKKNVELLSYFIKRNKRVENNEKRIQIATLAIMCGVPVGGSVTVSSIAEQIDTSTAVVKESLRRLVNGGIMIYEGVQKVIYPDGSAHKCETYTRVKD